MSQIAIFLRANVRDKQSAPVIEAHTCSPPWPAHEVHLYAIYAQ